VYMYAKTNLMGLKAGAKAISDNFADEEKDMTNVTAQDLWDELKTELNETVEANIPSKTVRKRNNTPWLTRSIKRLHRQKQRAFNTAKKNNTQEAWDKYKQLRKKVKKETKKAYTNYIRDKVMESPKQFWSFIKSLKKDSTGIPALKENGVLVTDSKQKADTLNRQYQSQFTKERLGDLPKEPESKIPAMPDITVHKEGVAKLLKGLSPFKAAGVRTR